MTCLEYLRVAKGLVHGDDTFSASHVLLLPIFFESFFSLTPPIFP